MPNNIYLWASKVNFYLKKKKKRFSRKRSTGKRVASTRESYIPYPHGSGQLYVFFILGFPRPSETVILQSQLTVLLSIIISKQVGIRILLRISHYCLTAPLPPLSLILTLQPCSTPIQRWCRTLSQDNASLDPWFWGN